MLRRTFLAAAVVAGATTGLAADDPLLIESRAISEEFGNRLRSALQAAMAEGGPVGAIDVCKEVAPRLASELSRRTGAQVGRTSLRFRNPRNLPVEWQAEVLQGFDAGGPPGEFFERREDGQVRYMKAIPTGGLCVACHGTAIAEDVRNILAAHYPHDRAIGYEPGEIRGAFSVVWPKDADRKP